ncbi:zinc-dependent alcohol dehydrogenase [Actinomycetospora cinnamomea]|uniref:zinc-dependent alcohol dehydrogenase n=1 Tax=Actinomycetospora cinnamomea TaxID=663609 RepID=UPI001A9CA9E7|nr:zinc-binding alcohol dehydrogenase [Actinomycetospora cinnamomea]
MREAQVLVVDGPGRVRFVPDPPSGPLPAAGFDVTTRFSGLSAGTDLSWVKGTNPMLSRAWDAELGLFDETRPGAGYPVRKVGYMQVGEVTAAGPSSGRAVGDLVAMTYGHRTAHRVEPAAERVVPLPRDLDPVLGIYAAHMGPICANGVLHAAAEEGSDDLGAGVRDRIVAVVGAGVVGLLTALFAAELGAASVTVLDPTPGRRAVAEALGPATRDPDDPTAVADLKRGWRHGPGDHGADVVFQCRGRAAALATALRLLRPQATVIDLAFYADGAEAVRLGEEFHHNGLGVRCAQIGRVPRALRGAWDRDRLSAATLDLLTARGDDLVAHVVTDRVPLADAPAHLVALADGGRHTGIQTVFTA